MEIENVEIEKRMDEVRTVLIESYGKVHGSVPEILQGHHKHILRFLENQSFTLALLDGILNVLDEKQRDAVEAATCAYLDDLISTMRKSMAEAQKEANKPKIEIAQGKIPDDLMRRNDG